MTLTKSESCHVGEMVVGYRVGNLPGTQQADLISSDGGRNWKCFRSSRTARSVSQSEYGSADDALSGLAAEIEAELKG